MEYRQFIQSDFHSSTNEEFTWENSKIFNYELTELSKKYNKEDLIIKLTELKQSRLTSIKVKNHIKQAEIDNSKVILSNGIQVNIKPEWENIWIQKSKNTKIKTRLLNLANQKDFNKELEFYFREFNYQSIIKTK